MVPVEYWVSFLKHQTKNRSKTLATTTTIWTEVKRRGFTGCHYQTSQKYKEVTTYYKNNLNIIVDVIHEVHSPKTISTKTCQITMIPQYRAWNNTYLSQHHKNGSIRPGRENWTKGHVHLCTFLIHNGFNGVTGELSEIQEYEITLVVVPYSRRKYMHIYRITQDSGDLEVP